MGIKGAWNRQMEISRQKNEIAKKGLQCSKAIRFLEKEKYPFKELNKKFGKFTTLIELNGREINLLEYDSPLDKIKEELEVYLEEKYKREIEKEQKENKKEEMKKELEKRKEKMKSSFRESKEDWQKVRNSGNPIIKCSNCGSTNLQAVGNTDKKFSTGKAVTGAVLTGGVGLAAGFIGKKGKTQFHCQECGKITEYKL